MQDVLPVALRGQHGLGSWLDDLEEAHKPTTRRRYEQACRGLAMRVSWQTAVVISVQQADTVTVAVTNWVWGSAPCKLGLGLSSNVCLT
jgi:hypothetical protein